MKHTPSEPLNGLWGDTSGDTLECHCISYIDNISSEIVIREDYFRNHCEERIAYQVDVELVNLQRRLTMYLPCTVSSALAVSWPGSFVAMQTYTPGWASEGLAIMIVRLLTISLSPKLSLLISIVFACAINWLPILHHVICGLGRAVALQRKVAD